MDIFGGACNGCGYVFEVHAMDVDLFSSTSRRSTQILCFLKFG